MMLNDKKNDVDLLEKKGFDIVLDDIKAYVSELLTDEVSDLSKKSQRNLKQKFLEAHNQLLLMLHLDALAWEEAQIKLAACITKIEKLYEKTIDRFEEKGLVGLSEALKHAKEIELPLLQDLNKRLTNKQAAHGINTEKYFQEAYQKSLDERSKHSVMDDLPGSGTANAIAWTMKAGLASAAYAIKEIYHSIVKIKNHKKILNHSARLLGGVIGGGGGYFAAGAIISAVLGTVVMPLVGTILSAVAGVFMGAGMGMAAVKVGSKATSKMVFGETNPEKWLLAEGEKKELENKDADVEQIEEAMSAIHAEKDQAKGDWLEEDKDSFTIERLNDDLKKIRRGEVKEYHLGGKTFSFFRHDKPQDVVDEDLGVSHRPK